MRARIAHVGEGLLPTTHGVQIAMGAYRIRHRYVTARTMTHELASRKAVHSRCTGWRARRALEMKAHSMHKGRARPHAQTRLCRTQQGRKAHSTSMNARMLNAKLPRRLPDAQAPYGMDARRLNAGRCRRDRYIGSALGIPRKKPGRCASSSADANTEYLPDAIGLDAHLARNIRWWLMGDEQYAYSLGIGIYVPRYTGGYTVYCLLVHLRPGKYRCVQQQQTAPHSARKPGLVPAATVGLRPPPPASSGGSTGHVGRYALS